ncbi:MAG: hypothetical protein KAR42_09780 [candidate division Zixibacteria bacterium]|nr:hypothetical protein [candidate division Zixibacteria bacterium]
MPVRKKRRQTTLSKRLLYWGSHCFCAATAILIFLTLVQCTINKPEAPSWRTNITVPLMNKTWDMPELIEKIDQDNLTVDSLGNPMFYFNNVLDTVFVGGTFSIPDVVETVSESLGLVTLDPIPPQSFLVALMAEFPGLPAGTFPDTSFDISHALPALGNFTTATIASGSAVMVIENDFGLYLDTVIVAIIDEIAMQQIATYEIPGGIPAGTTSSDTIDLSGKIISNQLSAVIHCHAQQATSFTLADKSLGSSIGMPTGLTVSSAAAMMPEMTKSFSQLIDMNSTHLIESASIDNGRLAIEISNNTNVAANLVLTLPDFISNGSPLVINQTVYAQQGGQYYYNLANYTLEMIDQTLPQALSLDIDANIASSGGAIVTINAGDKISVTATIDNIEFGTINGIIAETSADFDSLQEELDVPTGFSNIQLPSAVLTLAIENSVNIPGSFSIEVDGDQGQHKSLVGTISPGTLENPVMTYIVDSTLTAFMNPIPEVFTVTGSATFGDGVTPGSISSADFLIAELTISSPMEMIIDSSIVDGEWTDTDIDIDSSVVNGFKNAIFHVAFENHLPLGITVEILLSGDSATLYSNPEISLGPVTVGAGVLNPDGTVSEATLSNNSISMDSTQIQVLHNDTLWVGELINLHSTNGASVKMSVSDYLNITGYIDLDINFSDDLWEDN